MRTNNGGLSARGIDTNVVGASSGIGKQEVEVRERRATCVLPLDKPSIDVPLAFPYLVQPMCAQHPACPFLSCLGVRRPSPHLVWQNLNFASAQPYLNCDYHEIMPATGAPFGVVTEIEQVNAGKTEK
jgi:hypothetical protein